MQFHLARFADLVLPEFRPDAVLCTSYDIPSHAPTKEALFRLKEQRKLPSPSVAGSYAAVVYEEAALERHARVAHLLRREKWNKPDPKYLHVLRTLAFVEVEAFLQGITEPYDEACTLVPGLLALPEILEPMCRRALAADMRDLLASPPEALRPKDVWAFALAAPALTRAAGGRDTEVDSAQAALDAMTVAILEDALLEEFETKAAALDALSLPGFLSVESMDGSVEWAADDTMFRRMKPIYRGNYDQMIQFIEHWCPTSAQRLRAPFSFRWTDPKAEFEVRPHPKNPLWGHAVTLTELG